LRSSLEARQVSARHRGAFAEEGARVVVADLDEKAGQETLSAISTAKVMRSLSGRTSVAKKTRSN
jgi:hypothetical protein